MIESALNEIDCAIHEFDSNSPEDYLDWEFDVDHCIDNFPPYSCRLGAVIVEKLVGFTKSWWRFYMIGRRIDGYGDRVSWDDIKSALREKLVPPNYHDQQFQIFVMLKQGQRSVKEYAEVFKNLVRRCKFNEPPVRLIYRFMN